LPKVLLTDGPAVVVPKATTAAPKSTWTPTRTLDGQPDLQGTWVNFDDTPFESSGPGTPAVGPEPAGALDRP
jgi:hypothetical protein